MTRKVARNNPIRPWPTVANRHRNQALDELEDINALLQEITDIIGKHRNINEIAKKDNLTMRLLLLSDLKTDLARIETRLAKIELAAKTAYNALDNVPTLALVEDEDDQEATG